ncbi:MaoC family dehydratase N-terminal domain-containing protein [Chloroflexota bacterium]
MTASYQNDKIQLFTKRTNMLPEEITSFIGKTGNVRTLEVEKGAIRKFADAMEDQNLLYWDEAYSQNSKYGNIIAPPGFFGWPDKWVKAGPLFSELLMELRAALFKLGYSHDLDGSIEYEFFNPILAGDTLKADSVIKNIKERKSGNEKTTFAVMEITYTNQNGEMVAKTRQTLVYQ